MAEYNEATKKKGDECLAEALKCFKDTGLPLDAALKAHLNAMNNYYFRSDLKTNQDAIRQGGDAMKGVESSNAEYLQQQCDAMMQYVKCLANCVPATTPA